MEIRARELAFTRAESMQLLAGQDPALSEDDIGLLWGRTEGWVAALRLAATALQGHPAPRTFIEQLAGTDSTIADYLVAEILARQPEDVRRFMLQTSLVDVLDGDLARELSDRSDAGRLLSGLARGNALVVAIDEHGRYRYHPLLAELLRAEMHHDADIDEPELHRRAAHWHAANGMKIEGIGHALMARDWELGGRLASENWLSLLVRGEMGRLGRLLASAPRDCIRESPELALAWAGTRIDLGDGEEARRYLALGEEGASNVPPERRARFDLTAATIRLYGARLRGDSAAALESARILLAPHAGDDALDRFADESDLRALALLNLGAAELWVGDLDAAARHLEAALATASLAGRDWIVLQATAHLCIRDSLAGHLRRSSRRAQEAIDLAEQRGWESTAAAGGAYASLGGVQLLRDELDDAAGNLERAERAVQGTRERHLRVLVALGRVRLLVARGQIDTALTVVRSAELELGDLPAPAAMRGELAAQEALLLDAMGDGARARRTLGGPGEDPIDAEGSIARAQLALADGDREGALRAVAPCVDGTSAGLTITTITRAWLVDAIARDALGQAAGASASLERALDVAEPPGLIRPFTALGSPARSLLRRQLRNGTLHRSFVMELLERLEPAGSARPVATPLLEALSEKELGVLRFLPTMMPNREIASEMFVSVNTVKTHLKHIYRKLDVTDRRQAVDRARELQLLGPLTRAGAGR